MTRPLVITSCTKRKRRGARPEANCAPRPSPPLSTFAADWMGWVDSQPVVAPAVDYYCGTGFSRACRTASEINGRLFVVSAGLGLVDAAVPVIDYDLTVTSGGRSLSGLLKRSGATAADWWIALSTAKGAANPLSTLIRRHEGIALIALPSVYCDLVRDDLARLTATEAKCLRLFTSEVGARLMPERLRPFVMPYDDRLEGTAHAGTRADFPQRCLHHFVSVLSGHSVGLKRARSLVEASMQESQKPALRRGARRTDEEVAELIRTNWVRFSGQSSRLLRFLRDDAQIACEQGRFRTIWAAVRSTYAA